MTLQLAGCRAEGSAEKLNRCKRETLELLQGLRLPRQCPLETFTARTGPVAVNVEVVVSCVCYEAVIECRRFERSRRALAGGVVTTIIPAQEGLCYAG